MSTSVWPPIAPSELLLKENESVANELTWLLNSLRETLSSLKSGLEDTYALLAPLDPGSTLVISSHRSEAVKGTITRVGTRVVKASLLFRLKTHAALSLTLQEDAVIVLDPLKRLRALLNEGLDCVDVTRWTGDGGNAGFMAGQLLLLHRILVEARGMLRGTSVVDGTITNPKDATWPREIIHGSHFSPELKGVNEDIAINIEIQEASLILTVRVLEDTSRDMGFGTKFAFAIGAQRRLEHDEMEGVYTIPGIPERSHTDGTATAGRVGRKASQAMTHARQVRVKEKIRVESADPNLLSAMAKIAALEHNVGMARCCLATVMGREMDEV